MSEVKSNNVPRKLNAFADGFSTGVDGILFAGAQRIVGRTSKYPPEIPGQKYQRTNTYKNTFSVHKIGKGRVSMTSDAMQRGRGYSPFVGGGSEGTQQASVHAGRWPVFRKEAEDELPVMQKEIDALVSREKAKAGL